MTKETKATAIAGGLVAVITAVLGVFVNGTMTDRDAKQAEQAQLNADIASLQKVVDTQEGLQAELENLKANVAQYIKILPSPEIATQERLMELVQEKSERAQFEITGFVIKPPTADPRKRASKAAFQEIEVTLNAKGTFSQFLLFLNSLERYESFVRVNSFTCTAPQTAEVDSDGKETWPLTVSLNISTFRFDAGGK
jgi:hypothetical protein